MQERMYWPLVWELAEAPQPVIAGRTLHEQFDEVAQDILKLGLLQPQPTSPEVLCPACDREHYLEVQKGHDEYYVLCPRTGRHTKRRFDPNAPLKRSIGETIGGNMTPMQRREAALNKALRNQLDNLTRREELMAAEVLRTGKVTVAGEDYPSVTVDFKRDAALSVTLTTGNKWGESGVDILDDLEDWSALVQEKSGAAARTVILDPKAWRLLKKNEAVAKVLDIRRLRDSGDLAQGPIVFGQANEKARYAGSIGDLDFWVYQDVYVDAAGQVQKLLPDNTVILGSTIQLEGVRCYGAIQDEKANYRAQRFFSKSWLEEDPAVRWLLMQSAPLVVPYRPNASFCATVA